MNTIKKLYNIERGLLYLALSLEILVITVEFVFLLGA
jgi:hypothetical protein